MYRRGRCYGHFAGHAQTPKPFNDLKGPGINSIKVLQEESSVKRRRWPEFRNLRFFSEIA